LLQVDENTTQLGQDEVASSTATDNLQLAEFIAHAHKERLSEENKVRVPGDLEDEPSAVREEAAAQRLMQSAAEHLDRLKAPVKEKLLDEFVGRAHAALTNAGWAGQTNFNRFDEYYNTHFKDVARPFQMHAQDLSHQADASYESMAHADGVFNAYSNILTDVQQKASDARLAVDKESKEVAGKSLNAFGALRKYHEDGHSIDENYNGPPLDEKKLLKEGQRHAETGKWDFWQNEGFPNPHPRVTLQELDSPEQQHVINPSVQPEGTGAPPRELGEGSDGVSEDLGEDELH